MYGFKAHEYYIIVSTMLLRGRSLTTLTKSCPLLTTYPTPGCHWRRNFFTVITENYYGPFQCHFPTYQLGTYLPRLVNLAKERPPKGKNLRRKSISSAPRWAAACVTLGTRVQLHKALWDRFSLFGRDIFYSWMRIARIQGCQKK